MRLSLHQDGNPSRTSSCTHPRCSGIPQPTRRYQELPCIRWYLQNHSNVVFFSPTAMLAFVNGPKGNSLTLGKFESYLRSVICKLILVVDDWGIPCEIVLGLMSLNLTDDKPTLVQVMSWCLQTTNHHYDNVNPVQYRHMASLGCNWLIHVTKAASQYDDVIKWFSALLSLCAGNSPVTGEFP